MSKIIYLITDGTLTTQNFSSKSVEMLKLIEIAVENNISLIQIREKLLPARLVFELTIEAVKLANNSNTKILVNDRADVALSANANGVHLTSTSISANIIRQTFPKNFIIGVSAHSLETVELAKNQGANFVTFSSIYTSPNKGKPFGLNALREICENVKPFPVVALGGIDETNYREVLQIADGLAAIRFLNNVENLRKLKNENMSFNRRT